MTTFLEGRHTGEFLIMKEEDDYSVETVTVASGAGKLSAGTVLGVVTASGKYAVYANGASDGTQAAKAVLYDNVDATSADVSAVVVVRLAEVNAAELVWDASNSGSDITAGLADLKALGIVAR